MTSFNPLWTTPERPLAITRPPEDDVPPPVFQPLWSGADRPPSFSANGGEAAPAGDPAAPRFRPLAYPAAGATAQAPETAPEAGASPSAATHDMPAPPSAGEQDRAVAGREQDRAVAGREQDRAVAGREQNHEVAGREDRASDAEAEFSPAPEARDEAPAGAPLSLTAEAADAEPSPDPAPDAPVVEPAAALAQDATPAAPVIVGVPFEDHAAALAAARAAALEEGRNAALAEMQADVERERAALRDAVAAVQGSLTDTTRLFEPLKRLALHLAAQLVRGELTLSGEAIGRLVDGCLAEMDPREAVVVRLNPADADTFRAQLAGTPELEIAGDSKLARGSVRVELGDGWVEDLIEHRLDALSQSLLGEPWTPPKPGVAPPRDTAPAAAAPPPPPDVLPADVRPVARPVAYPEPDDEYAYTFEPLVPRNPIAAYRDEPAVLEHDA